MNKKLATLIAVLSVTLICLSQTLFAQPPQPGNPPQGPAKVPRSYFMAPPPQEVGDLNLLTPFKEKYDSDRVISQITSVPFDSQAGFKFVVFGDTRSGMVVARQVLGRIESEKPLFAIVLGDMVPSGAVEEWVEQYFPALKDVSVPLLHLIGNHDMGAQHQKEEYKYIFGKLDYTFDYGNCRFLILDNAAGSLTEEQLTWTDKTLGETPAGFKRFVFAHIPPATIDKWAFHSFTTGAESFTELMAKHKVDDVFLGHIHAYSTQTLNGVNYIVTGGGGAPLMPQYGPEGSLFHYITVSVTPASVSQTVSKLKWITVPPGNDFFQAGSQKSAN